MAIANSEVLNILLNPNDYNVRVTVSKSENISDSLYMELIRDSLGGGIIHSDNMYTLVVYIVNDDGSVTDLHFNSCGKELISQVSFFLTSSVGVRFDIADDKKNVRSWIIIR